MARPLTPNRTETPTRSLAPSRLIVPSRTVLLPNSAWPQTFAALEAALAAGGTVNLNPLTYTGSEAGLILPAGLTLNGNGAILESVGNTMQIQGNNYNINNLIIYESETTYVSSSSCIAVWDGSENVLIKDVAFNNVGHGINEVVSIFANTLIENVTLDHVIVNGSSGIGFMNAGYNADITPQLTNINYLYCQAINCGIVNPNEEWVCGFDLAEVIMQLNNLYCLGCIADGNQYDGFHYESNHATVVGAQMVSCIARNNGFGPNPGSGFSLQLDQYSSATLLDCDAHNNNYSGFVLSGNVIATGCTAENNTGPDFILGGTNGAASGATLINCSGASCFVTGPDNTMENFTLTNSSNGTPLYIYEAADCTLNINATCIGSAPGTFGFWPIRVQACTGTITITGTLVTNSPQPINWDSEGTLDTTGLTILAPITTAAISLPAPSAGGTPQTTIADNGQYTATVSWSPSDSPFVLGRVYTATVTITPDSGYTLQTIPANFFTLAGATVTNAANSGVVTIVFPAAITTWNPADMGSHFTLSNGNATATYAGTGDGVVSIVRSTTSKSTGKWYFEVTVNAATYYAALVGIANSSANLNQYLGSNANGRAYYGQSGQKYENGSGVAYGATYGTGDVIGVAVDVTDGTVTFYKDGTSQGVAFTDLASLGAIFAAVSAGDPGNGAYGVYTINFGDTAFAYSIPSGYSAWD